MLTSVPEKKGSAFGRRAANTGTYEVEKARSCLFISQRLNSGIFSVLISRKGPQRLNVKLKATITLHDFFP